MSDERENEGSGAAQREPQAPPPVEGTLYTADLNDDSRELLREITVNGNSFTVSKTSQEHKSPYIRTARAEVVGREAILRYLRISTF